MTESYEALNYKDDVDAFVREVSKAVCKSYGLDPDGTYSMSAGFDDEGNHIFEDMPNADRFEQDVRAALEYLCTMDEARFEAVMRIMRAYNKAQERVTRMMEESDDE